MLSNLAYSDQEELPLSLDEAFAPLLAYDKRLLNIAARILGDRDEAMDAVQDAYLSAYRGFAGFRGDSQPFTWLCRITLHECARRGRKKTQRRSREVDLELVSSRGHEPGAHDAGHAIVDKSTTSRKIREVVRSLPEAYRDVVVLRYFEQMSYAEIAAITNCMLGTVKSRLSRAHARLAKLIPSEFLADVQ